MAIGAPGFVARSTASHEIEKLPPMPPTGWRYENLDTQLVHAQVSFSCQNLLVRALRHTRNAPNLRKIGVVDSALDLGAKDRRNNKRYDFGILGVIV